MTTKSVVAEVSSARAVVLSIRRRILAIVLFWILFAATLMVTSNARADAQEIWVNQFGSTSYDEARDISVHAGRLCVVGNTNGILPGQTTTGPRDAFVRMLSSNGCEMWTRQFGTSTYDDGNAVSIDASGVYVAGATAGTLPDQTSAGGWDAFVWKFDSNGDDIWRRQFGSAFVDYADDISVDSSGVYVVGHASGALPGQTDSWGGFVRKYDSGGNEAWTRQFGDYIYGISVDASGVYVAGQIGSYAFVQKYDSNGYEKWTKQFGITSSVAYRISVSASGVYVSGQWGYLCLNAFVAKYDGDGNQIWIRIWGTGSYDTYLTGVHANDCGVFVVGTTSSCGYVRKYDSFGNYIWLKQLGTSNQYSPNGVSVDASDVYVAGRTAGDAFVTRLLDMSPPVIFSFTASSHWAPEGSPITFEVAASDSNGDPLAYLYDFNGDGVFDEGGSDSTVTHVYPDNGGFNVRVRVSDGTLYAESVTFVQVYNSNPVVTMTSPASGLVIPVGATLTFTGEFSDAGTGDTHTARWWIAGTVIAGTVTEVGGSGTVEGTYTFSSVQEYGIYLLALEVFDDDGGHASAGQVGGLTAYVVVYDPSAGFVVGGGWIYSPQGSYCPDSSLSGKATFGFVSRYEKGANVPTGETEFQFRVADMNFHSTVYEWLVVAGARAMFKGSGTINGEGDYSFMLIVIDGALPGGWGMDTLNMQIWDKASGMWVYYNWDSYYQEIGGGSIIIHK